MKILQKKLLTFLVTLCIGMTSMTGMVFAYVGDPSVANDTKETAYQLTQNTIADSLIYNPKIVHNCYLSDSNDEDWFKVYLSAGTQTLTINSLQNNKIADVYSQDGSSLIFEGTFGPSTKRGQKFQVATAGTYYIKIHSNESFSTKSEYTIFVGAPWYKRGTYSKSLNTNMSVSPTKKVSNIVNFNLSTDAGIPNSAIVETISLDGTETNKNAVSGKVRSLKPSLQNSWFDISGIVFFDQDVLNTTNPIMLKQSWAFKHSVSGFYSGYTSYSLNPVIKFTYLYEDNDI